jgi:hypothetical protein
MEANIKFVSYVDGRLIIETDTTFPAYDKDGNEGVSSQFSIGMKTAIVALSSSPIGAIVAAKCGGRPNDYKGVDNALVFALFGAHITFERKKLNVGDTRMDGNTVEKPCYQTEIKALVSKADISMLMRFVQCVSQKETTAQIINPFK